MFATKAKDVPIVTTPATKVRVGIYQVMPMFESIREMVISGCTTADIKRESMRLGVKTMRQSALTKLKEGYVSFEEVIRVTAADDF